VMGTVAFVMAGYTGIPYLQICVASILPAVLYYAVLLFYAEIHARKMHISREPVPLGDKKELMFDAALFLGPLGVLTILLFMGRSLMNLAFWAIITALVISLARKKTRPSLKELVTGIVRGSKSGAEVAVSCGLIGIIVTCFSVTGLGIKLPSVVEGISGGMLPIALIFVMIIGTLLGAGVPTVVAYILVAVIAVPTVMRMGVPLLQAHYFAMWYAVSAHLTPPVAIGALVAAGLAGARFWATCAEALKAALATFFIPWFIVYNPVLILRPQDFVSGLAGIISCVFGLGCLQVAVSNYLMRPIEVKERLGFFLAAIAFFATLFGKQHVLVLVGLAIMAVTFTYYMVKTKSYRMEGAAAN
jgi:TRAP transporter 4TM/12TM fusion protein